MVAQLFVLYEGRYYTDSGVVIAVGRSKAALIRWVRQHRPEHKRRRSNESGVPKELYWENDKSHTWLKCDHTCAFAI